MGVALSLNIPRSRGCSSPANAPCAVARAPTPPRTIPGGVWSATLGECDTPRTYLSMDSLPSLILSIATVAAAMIAAPLLPKGLSTALECVAVHRPAAHTALSHSLTPVCPPPDASASVAGS